MEDFSDILGDVLNEESTGSDTSTESNIEDMSKDEIAKKAIREGRVKIDDERAVIRCPHTSSSSKWIKGGKSLTDTVNKYYACPVFPAPDPDTPGEMKMVCGGPMRCMKEYESHDHTEMGAGTSAFSDCPYNSDRLKDD